MGSTWELPCLFSAPFHPLLISHCSGLMQNAITFSIGTSLSQEVKGKHISHCVPAALILLMAKHHGDKWSLFIQEALSEGKIYVTSFQHESPLYRMHLVWRRLCVLEGKRVLDFLFNVFKPLVSNSFYFEKNPYYCYVFIVNWKLWVFGFHFFPLVWFGNFVFPQNGFRFSFVYFSRKIIYKLLWNY